MAVIAHAQHHSIERQGQIAQSGQTLRQTGIRRRRLIDQRHKTRRQRLIDQQMLIDQPCVGADIALRHPALVRQRYAHLAPVQFLM